MPDKDEDVKLSTEHKTTSSDQHNESEPVDKCFIRDCKVYEDEYSDCKSFRARFNQLFIYGDFIDCNQWKKDYDNCCKWVDSKDVKAANSLIASEKARHLERFKAHYRNDVWKKRDSPPTDWAKPLPEWMLKRDENTYLAQRAKELQEGQELVEEKSSFCTIM